jgi:hypothetical protein
MAKLKVNKLDLYLKRRPNLPDWYRFLAYFLGLIVVITLFFNLIRPENNSITTNNNKNILSTLSNEVTSGSEPVISDTLVEELTYSGETEKISNQVLSVAILVANSIVSGDFTKVPMSSGDVAPLYNIATDSIFDKIYLNTYSNDEATFTVLINENPNSKSNIRTNLTVRLSKESGSWIFPSDLNQGV